VEPAIQIGTPELPTSLDNNAHGLFLPIVRLGSPASPQLFWTLLADNLSNGSRGVGAMEDQNRFGLSLRMITQSETFIVPRLDPVSGQPLTYRLEPFVPTVSVGDRQSPPFEALIPFRFPSGSLTVRIQNPDGTINVLGPAPFAQSGMKGLADPYNGPMEDGPHPANIYQLSTMDPHFQVQFPHDGLYIITLSGSVDHIWGDTWTGGGTYKVYVVRTLSLDTAVLPGTPFEVGKCVQPLRGADPAPSSDGQRPFAARAKLRFEQDDRSDHQRAFQSLRLFSPAEQRHRVEPARGISCGYHGQLHGFARKLVDRLAHLGRRGRTRESRHYRPRGARYSGRLFHPSVVFLYRHGFDVRCRQGSGLAPDSRTWQASDFSSNQLPQSLDGVSVTMNGKNAYVYYISPSQINVLTPSDLNAGAVQVQVTFSGLTSAPFTVQSQLLSPSFFVIGRWPVRTRTHADGTLIGPPSLYPGSTTPARTGETVVVYANGLGATSVPVVGGSESQSGVLIPMPKIQVGGMNPNVRFAGLISPGLYQIDFDIPVGLPAGDNAILATLSGSTTQAGTLITVQP
jgi:uncharacterized protein (TIGR03437 family)